MQIKDSHTINGITYFTPPPPIVSNTLDTDTSDTSKSSLNAEFNANFHFPSEGMDMLYLAENKHFWHIARREFIYQEISRILASLYPQDNGKSTKILDLGAGTGSVTRHFLSQGFNNIALGEIHPQGLEYAKTYGIKDLYCMDLLDVPFADEFDCIFAFDVLDHLVDDYLALKNIKTMLRANSKSCVAISVPAHKWLWNAHDVSIHHKHRYTKKEITSIMNECGFEVCYIKHFFVSIAPLLYLRALLYPAKYPDNERQNNILQEHTNKEHNKEELRDTPPPALINKALLGICRLENKIQHYLPQNLSAPFGGSLLVVGRSII